MALRAGFETLWYGRCCGPDLVRLQFLEQFAPSPKYALVRTEKLVGGANQEITTDGLYISCNMRDRLNTVDIRQGAGGSCLRTDRRYVVQRPGQIACAANAEEPCALRNQIIENLEIEFECVDIEGQPRDLEIQILGEHSPRPDIGIVIHARKDDLVAGSKQPADRTGNMHRYCRHVLTEHDLVTRRRIEKIRHRVAGRAYNLSCGLRRSKVATKIRIG